MSDRRGGLLLGLAAVTVAVAIGIGVRVIGSPSEARERRLDDRRVEALNEISYAVDRYYALHKKLPVDLAALKDVSPVTGLDPITAQPLEYRVRDPKGYEVCAVFSRRSPAQDSPNFWWHDAGRQCYGLVVREQR